MSRTTDAPEKLAQATIDVVRAKGYAATRVEDICAAAGVTKGSFFHHFDTKDEAAEAAAAHWAAHVRAFFGAAPYWEHEDPVERLLGYVDFRVATLEAPIETCSCFAGTMIQEVHATHPALRAACAVAVDEHIEEVERLVRAAIASRGLEPEWTAKSLAQHIQGVVQGALILAKAADDMAPARATFAHLRRYLEQIFAPRP